MSSEWRHIFQTFIFDGEMPQNTTGIYHNILRITQKDHRCSSTLAVKGKSQPITFWLVISTNGAFSAAR
jgi:hypothetical protein